MTIDVSEVKRRLFALLKDSNLVSKYIRQYGPTIDIQAIKKIKKANSENQDDKEEVNDGKDPLFVINVKCPVCSQEEIECCELKAKSQATVLNKFLVPSYKGAMGYKTLNFLMCAVTVCHRCLFASPDKKDFIRSSASAPGDIKSQLPSNHIMTLQEKIGERKVLLKSISDYKGYFKFPRTYDAAIASYRLAMTRANVETYYEQPYSLFKLGSYTLRIAKLIKDFGGDNREALREAEEYLEEAFITSNCPSEEIEMQAIYLIFALNLKLGEHKKANSYLGVFSNLKNSRKREMKENPALTTQYIDRWNENARRLWKDRDMNDLFKDE